MSQPYTCATNHRPHDARQTIRESIADGAHLLARQMWRRTGFVVVYELYESSFLQHRGFFLPGLVGLPHRGGCADGHCGMVTETSTGSVGGAGVDLSWLDCIIHIRAMAHILWLVRRVNYGT